MKERIVVEIDKDVVHEDDADIAARLKRATT